MLCATFRGNRYTLIYLFVTHMHLRAHICSSFLNIISFSPSMLYYAWKKNIACILSGQERIVSSQISFHPYVAALKYH